MQQFEIVPAFDYSWRCDCDGAEGNCRTLREARQEAKKHLKECTYQREDGKPLEVFIDEYDLSEAEMSDRWWKVTK